MAKPDEQMGDTQLKKQRLVKLHNWSGSGFDQAEEKQTAFAAKWDGDCQ